MGIDSVETPFLHKLGKALVDRAFSSLPVQPCVSTTFAAIFPNAKCLSISVAAPDSIFISAISRAGTSGSCPALCLQPGRGTLVGTVAAEQCARIIESRHERQTGLSDVDYAASEFECNAMISVPIPDPAIAGLISGVLSLGYLLEESSDPSGARYRANCMCRVLVEIGLGMAPFLSEKTAMVISDLTSCFLPWPRAHPLSCTCMLCGSRLGGVSGASDKAEPASPKGGFQWGAACREGVPGGSDSDSDLDPGTNRVPADRNEPSSAQLEPTRSSQGVMAQERGGDLSGGVKKGSSKRFQMHPFWLSFSDRAVEAKFAAWFAAWMHKIDIISHVALMVLLVISAAKQCLAAAQAGNLAIYLNYLKSHLVTSAFFLFRIAIMLLGSNWYIRHRDILLIVTPMFGPLVVRNRVPPARHWPEQKLENFAWLARSLYVVIFAISTFCNMVRFRVSFPLYLFCAAYSALVQLRHVCGAPSFENVPTSVCVPWGISLLAAGLVLPHCITWAYERRSRQIWMTRHMD